MDEANQVLDRLSVEEVALLRRLSEKLDVLDLKQSAPEARARVFQELNNSALLSQSRSNRSREADSFTIEKRGVGENAKSCHSEEAEELTSP